MKDEAERAEERPAAFLTDFGLARDTTTGSKFTRTGTTLGTPAYMSPEQARGELAALTPAADVWSLGVLGYELLAGRRPFAADTDAALVAQILTGVPPSLRTTRADMPAHLDGLVRACLGKPALARPANAGALRADLDRVLRGRRPRVRPRRGARLVAAAGAILALGALVVAAIAWRGGAAPEPATPPSRARSQAAQAGRARTADPGGAAALLAAALADEPDRHDWRLERGLLLWAIGESVQALAEWKRIQPPAPEAAHARLYEGLEAFSRFQAREASASLRAATAGRGDPSVLAAAALRLIDRDWRGARTALRGVVGWEAALLRGYLEDWDPAGDKLVAVREYGAALTDGVPLAWAWNNRGLAREAQGDVAGALEDFGRAIEIAPAILEAWGNRARLRSAQGDLGGALADWERAVRLEPQRATLWRSRATAKAKVGDPAGAVADFDEAIRIEPQHAPAWNDRGVAKHAQRDFAGALADFGRAIELDPKLIGAWNARGLTRAALGDLAGAVADYDRALAIDPQNADVWTNRGGARQGQGDAEGAIADFGRALDANPRLAPAWCNRASARAALGDVGGALADLDRALAIDPQLTEALASRGALRLHLRELPSGIQDLRQALALAPPGWPLRPEIERLLADARAAAGE